jgi:4-hydroxy-tetrahydrodipicolinate synthase
VAGDFHGIFPYLVSPLDAAGRVREDVLRDLVDHLVGAGVHGLSPLGSTGESPYLNAEQRAEIVRASVAAARGRVPVVPGVAAFATQQAIAEARRSVELGADGVVLILQQYFPLPRPAVEAFFREVAAAVSCPIVLYSNPRLAGVALSADLVASLADVPNIRYFKEASGQTGEILTVLNRTHLKVFSASAHIPLTVLQLGGVGWMAGPACLLPRECVRLYDLATAGRWGEAMDLQRRLWRVNEVFQKHGLAACVKAGLTVQGFDVGPPIPPQLPLPEAAVAEIGAALREAGAG